MTPTDLHLTVTHQANELRLAKELIADQQRMLLKLKDDLAQAKATVAEREGELASLEALAKQMREERDHWLAEVKGMTEFGDERADDPTPAAPAAPSEGG